jgi:hypothetical protein
MISSVHGVCTNGDHRISGVLSIVTNKDHMVYVVKDICISENLRVSRLQTAIIFTKEDHRVSGIQIIFAKVKSHGF